MKIKNSTPKQDGYTMPFEGIAHQGTLMLLPFRGDTWREMGKPARKVFKKIVKEIAQFEKVFLGVHPNIYDEVSKEFTLDNVILMKLSYNDAWARDTMPIFVINEEKQVRGIDFRFNAWGGIYNGLYQDYFDDDELSAKICQYLNYDYYHVEDFILEGGSIHSDGEGTLLVTEACLLSPGRNPSKSKTEIEGFLKDYLGIKKVIWLPRGIYLDETSEHVDNVACFIAPGHVALAWCDNKNDPQYQLTQASYKVLQEAVDAKGRKVHISKIPLPSKPLLMTEAEAKGIKSSEHNAKMRISEARLAASYINFYQGRDFVILPGFGIKEDKNVLTIMQELYPQKKIIQIQTREVLLAGGNIHCITMQIPK